MNAAARTEEGPSGGMSSIDKGVGSRRLTDGALCGRTRGKKHGMCHRRRIFPVSAISEYSSIRRQAASATFARRYISGHRGATSVSMVHLV